MGVIYKITNKLNGKSYIGATTRPLKVRIREHFKGLYQRNNYFHNEIRSVGELNCDICVLEKDIPQDKLLNREEYWILKFKSNNPKYGYNKKTEGIGAKFYAYKQVYQFGHKGGFVKKWKSCRDIAQWLLENNLPKTKKEQNVVAAIYSHCLKKDKKYCGYYWSYDRNFKLNKKNKFNRKEWAKENKKIMSAKIKEALKNKSKNGEHIGRFVGSKNKHSKLDKYYNFIDFCLSKEKSLYFIRKQIKPKPHLRTLKTFLLKSGLVDKYKEKLKEIKFD